MPSLLIYDDLALWTNEKFVLLVRFTYATITHVRLYSYPDDLDSAPLLLKLRIYWDWIKPVSYTHLDVYKRQLMG